MTRRGRLCYVVAALLWLLSPAAVLCEDVVTSTASETPASGDADAQGRRESREDDASLWRLVECVGEDVVSDCLAERTSRAIHSILDVRENSDLAKAFSDDSSNELNPSSPAQGSMANLIGQVVGEGLYRLLPLLVEDDDDDDEEAEENAEDSQNVSDDKPENKSGLKGESRKKKKKKLLMKIHNLIQKLFMLKMLIKSKFAMILMKLSFLVQLKLVLIVLANLLVNVYRLYLQKTHQPEAQKVVYYEHAQHQHHYDQEHFHHGGGDDDKGWLGNLWSRSVQEEPPSPHNAAYSAHAPLAVRQDAAPRLPFLTPRPLLG